LNHKKLYIGALFFICTLAFAAQAQEAPGFEPSWLSLLPPVVAIILALITKQTLISLFAGIWIGVSLLAGNPITGLTTALDTYIVGAVADTRPIIPPNAMLKSRIEAWPVSATAPTI
jgi:Na+/H+-translocating membrane pyrophosphatase